MNTKQNLLINELCDIILNQNTDDKIEVGFYCLPKKLSNIQENNTNIVCKGNEYILVKLPTMEYLIWGEYRCTYKN